jgi:hypothetical protein
MNKKRRRKKERKKEERVKECDSSKSSLCSSSFKNHLLPGMAKLWLCSLFETLTSAQLLFTVRKMFNI